MARPVSRRGEGRDRLLEAAVTLFAERGVSGTSLHMVADQLGVTKAAVYHHFKTKESIVLAVLTPAFDQMASFIAAAEAALSREAQLDLTLAGLVDVVVEHRRVAAILRGDPAVTHVIGTHAPFHALADRLGQLLAGPDPSTSDRVAVAVVGGGLMVAAADTQLADLDDDTLRRELLHCLRTLLQQRKA